MNLSPEKQSDYYERTAAQYDAMHLEEPEHEYALAQLMGLVRYFKFESILDVGAGTGRVIRHTKKELPQVRIAGVEPVKGLREIGYREGIPADQLTDGNALHLDHPDNSWDLVCAFGILHHIPQPEKAISEMCRVARHGVFFSDLNNYGCGSFPQRAFSQTLRMLHLWKPFQYVKNGGKFEKFSEGDGIHYSYSLFDSLSTIRQKFPQLHLGNTKGSSGNLYSKCSHISVFAAASATALEERRRVLGR